MNASGEQLARGKAVEAELRALETARGKGPRTPKPERKVRFYSSREPNEAVGRTLRLQPNNVAPRADRRKAQREIGKLQRIAARGDR